MTKLRSRIALTMGVGRHVDRHVVDGYREVGAVIEIDATQVVLVRLALAAMLADEEAGDALEQLPGAHEGPVLYVLLRDRPLRGRVRAADQIVDGVGDLYGLERLYAARPGRRG